MGGSDGKCVMRTTEGTEKHGRRRLCWETANRDQSVGCADEGIGSAWKAPVLERGCESDVVGGEGNGGASKAPVLEKGQEGGKS